MNNYIAGAVKRARRLIVGVVGLTVLAIGVALIVLPGPAVVVLLAGLGILATEFAWARRLLRKAKAVVENTKNNWKNNRSWR